MSSPSPKMSPPSPKEIKAKLNKILKAMNQDYPLSSLCEDIEYNLGKKFTFLSLRDILSKTYKDIKAEDRIYLLKYLPSSQLGIKATSPYINLPNLFAVFSKILNEPILAPSLIMYTVANIIEHKYSTSTIEFIYSLKLSTQSAQNINEFFDTIVPKLQITELYAIILFKSLDYKKQGLIKMEDFIVAVDSYRDDATLNLTADNATVDADAKNSAMILSMFFDKNFITIDQLYENQTYNYMKYDDLKNKIKHEVLLTKDEGKLITDTIIDNVLLRVSRAGKIFKEDLDNYLPKKSTSTDKKANEARLSDMQKYYINKYIEALASVAITPKMAFESAARNNNDNIVNLDDLKRQLKILLPCGRITVIDGNNIMDSFDVNGTRTISYDAYMKLIDEVEAKKNEKGTYSTLNKTGAEKAVAKGNVWAKGIKSVNYYLLPVKGNYNVMKGLLKDIASGVKEEEENLKQSSSSRVGNRDVMVFGEEENQAGDENANIVYEDGQKYYVNEEFEIKKKEKKEKKEEKREQNYDESTFQDEFNLIKSFEAYIPLDYVFPVFDVMNYLVLNNSFPKATIASTLKEIDSDEDGFISLVNISSYLLHNLKHRSTIITLKYLALLIRNKYKCEPVDFFARNDIDIYSQIYINDLMKFLSKLKIENPNIKKLFDEMGSIFPPPITYKHLIDLINEYAPSKQNGVYQSTKEVIDMKNFEKKVREIANNLIDDEDYITNDLLRAKNFRENIKTFFNACPTQTLSLNQYNIFFSKPLSIDPNVSITIFQLLKSLDANGEQFITIPNLISFLESYTVAEEEVNQSNIIDCITGIEGSSAPLSVALELVPFSPQGAVSIVEVKRCLSEVYSRESSGNIMRIVNEIDDSRTGMATYLQMQTFLFEFSRVKFSFKIEMEFVASELMKNNVTNVNDYFTSEGTDVKNFNCVDKMEHAKLFGDLSTSSTNRDNVFDVLCRKSSSTTGYDITVLCDILNYYIMSCDGPLVVKDEQRYETQSNLETEKKSELPNKAEFNKAMENLKIGCDGYISICEFVKLFDVGDYESLVQYFDPKRVGFINFEEFLILLRNKYPDIKVSYKLCAVYIFNYKIKQWNRLLDFVLTTSGCKDTTSYLSHDVFYSKFIFAFANDKQLFETYFNIYKDKKGTKAGLLSLNSYVSFIKTNNNYEEEKIEENSDEESDTRSVIHCVNKVKNPQDEITEIVKNCSLNIKSIINNLNPAQMDIKDDFSIKEKYISTYISAHTEIDDDSLESFMKYFRLEKGRFNLRKLFQFSSPDYSQVKSSEILPKIKNHISNSPYKTFKPYLQNAFGKEFLSAKDVFAIIPKLYKLTNYQCLCIMKEEQFVNMEKFFIDNSLKDLFTTNEQTPQLKLALKRLSDYFDQHKDKLKVFKKFDLDKNGTLSTEEFITALNSMKDLNLNDSQKYDLLKIADKDKNGKIDPREFLAFVKSVKSMANEEPKGFQLPSISNKT